MRRTLPPSAEIQAEIDKLLGKGLVDDPQKMLGDLARLGARLIIQREANRASVVGAARLPSLRTGRSRTAGPLSA